MPRQTLPIQQHRSDRLGFRLDGQTKALIERAAGLEHRKVSDFCVTALKDAARRIIEDHDALVLSDRDRAAFFEAILNPPEPNTRLHRAFADHAHRIGG